MAERDDDLDFDFFEEPSTQETAVGGRVIRRRPPQPGPPRPPVRPPGGITPVLRLVGLIAFTIVAVLVLVFVIQGCRDEGKADKYRTYMTNVSQVASESQSIGRELNKALTTPGIEEAELEQDLNGLAQRQQQLVANAQGFDVPGRLIEEQQALEESLQLRTNGLRGLETVFRRTADSDDADRAGEQLAAQSQRFVASDVVWDDFFRVPAREELQQEGVTGVQVPSSDFLASPEFATVAVLKPIWQRIHGGTTGGTPAGRHGTNIVSTKVLPDAQELSQDTETTIKASTDLAFEVTVENSGEFPEVEVEVTLTIQRSEQDGGPITRKDTIPLINAGELKTVTFSDLGEPPFARPTTVKVDVKPVAGEVNTGNNTAEYPVIFSLE
jgi:hypothetical protein